MDEQKVRVWDLPLRLFHWCLLILICISVYTGTKGGFKEMDYHMLSGYALLALMLFRILWGLFGSTYSRFRSFLCIRGVLPYARHLFQKGEPAIGHNPLGGLSILAILLVITTQASTGLFANDDIMLEGPLVYLISDEASDLLTTIHHLNVWLLGGLIGLHVFAIAFYEIYRKERLVIPMITGNKYVKGEKAESRPLRELTVAASILGVVSAFVYWLVN